MPYKNLSAIMAIYETLNNKGMYEKPQITSDSTVKNWELFLQEQNKYDTLTTAIKITLEALTIESRCERYS